MEDYSIAPLSPEDVPTMAAFLHTSKQQLTINRVLFKDWPNEAAQRAVYTRAVESGTVNPLVQRWKVVHDPSGEMVAHVVLRRVNGSKDQSKEEEAAVSTGSDNSSQEVKGDIPDGFNAEVYWAVNDGIKQITKGWEGKDHFELTHVFVAMDHRNKGIGSHLVRMCIEKAEAEGLPLTLGAEPQAHSLFLKLGFVDEASVDFDLTKWASEYCGFGLFRLWGMVFKK